MIRVTLRERFAVIIRAEAMSSLSTAERRISESNVRRGSNYWDVLIAVHRGDELLFWFAGCCLRGRWDSFGSF